MRVWINGRSSRTVDYRDRGLQYGDGVFETMYVRAHAVRLLDLHLARLKLACRRLEIEPPPNAALRREIARAAACRRQGVLKLVLTRGVGPRGYRPSGDERATRILTSYPLPRRAPVEVPVQVRVCRTPVSTNPALAGLKSLNRLDAVLARSEWRDPRVFEGLMRDVDGHIVCGTMSNIFLRRGADLITPLLDRCGVAGVMRRWVMGQVAAMPLRLVERRVRAEELERAEEIFLTNAVVGIVSVGSVRSHGDVLKLPSCRVAARLREELRAV